MENIIKRTTKTSYFLKLHQTSPLADRLFDALPKHNEMKVEILQVMIIPNDYLIAEIRVLDPNNNYQFIHHES